MTAERKAIRKSLQAMLMGTTLVGNKVFSSRAYSVFAQDLPVIVIYTRKEDSEIFDVSPRKYKRTINLAVEIIAKADADLDDFLDDVAEQVEGIVAADDTLGGKASEARVVGTEMITDASGETTIGACIITFGVDYFKLAPEDGTEELGAFTKANLKVDVAPADGQIEQESLIDIPQ